MFGAGSWLEFPRGCPAVPLRAGNEGRNMNCRPMSRWCMVAFPDIAICVKHPQNQRHVRASQDITRSRLDLPCQQRASSIRPDTPLLTTDPPWPLGMLRQFRTITNGHTERPVAGFSADIRLLPAGGVLLACWRKKRAPQNSRIHPNHLKRKLTRRPERAFSWFRNSSI